MITAIYDNTYVNMADFQYEILEKQKYKNQKNGKSFFCSNTETHFLDTKYYIDTKKHFLVEAIFKELSPNQLTSIHPKIIRGFLMS